MSMDVHLHLGAKATVTARVWPPLADEGKPYATLELYEPGGNVVRVYVASAEQLRDLAREAERVAFDLANTALHSDLVDIRCMESGLRGEAA